MFLWPNLGFDLLGNYYFQAVIHKNSLGCGPYNKIFGLKSSMFLKILVFVYSSSKCQFLASIPGSQLATSSSVGWSSGAFWTLFLATKLVENSTLSLSNSSVEYSPVVTVILELNKLLNPSLEIATASVTCLFKAPRWFEVSVTFQSSGLRLPAWASLEWIHSAEFVDKCLCCFVQESPQASFLWETSHRCSFMRSLPLLDVSPMYKLLFGRVCTGGLGSLIGQTEKSK